jgi:hypothetical protein
MVYTLLAIDVFANNRADLAIFKIWDTAKNQSCGSFKKRSFVKGFELYLSCLVANWDYVI